tara:strand:- start:3415 stop:4431 length:1017 start_codon:yes stop_codon:yes gene_type:complete
MKIESVQHGTYSKSSYISNNEIVGLYIMDHVLLGEQDSEFLSLKKFKKQHINQRNKGELREQLIDKLKKCLKKFYKIPKIHGDLHDSNIMVVFKSVSNKISIKRLTVIDYGTVFIIPKVLKVWSENDSLSTIYRKMKDFLEKKSKPFMTRTNEVYPLNSNIYLYNVKGGGQQLRNNKQLLDLYAKNLLSNAMKINSGKSTRKSTPKPHVNTIHTLSKASAGFIDSVVSLFGLGKSKNQSKTVRAKSSVLRAKSIKCGDCKCYKSSILSKGPKGGKFYMSNSKKVYCPLYTESKIKNCKDKCKAKSKLTRKSKMQTKKHMLSSTNNNLSNNNYNRKNTI